MTNDNFEIHTVIGDPRTGKTTYINSHAETIRFEYAPPVKRRLPPPNEYSGATRCTNIPTLFAAIQSAKEPVAVIYPWNNSVHLHPLLATLEQLSRTKKISLWIEAQQGHFLEHYDSKSSDCSRLLKICQDWRVFSFFQTQAALHLLEDLGFDEKQAREKSAEFLRDPGPETHFRPVIIRPRAAAGSLA